MLIKMKYIYSEIECPKEQGRLIMTVRHMASRKEVHVIDVVVLVIIMEEMNVMQLKMLMEI